MNEKRFTYDKPIVAFSKGGINDNVIDKTYEFTMDTVLDLLNGQQDKILQLEQENTDLLSDKIQSINEFEKCTNKLKSIIIKLREENKALKKFIKNNFNEMMDSKMVIKNE